MVDSNSSKTFNGKSREEVGKVELSRVKYTREELLVLEKTDLALLRPDCLDIQFDREGRWDPMAWHMGMSQAQLETAPVGTLEFRKRSRSKSNADAKDVEVILSPQRMSFGSGCAGLAAVHSKPGTTQPPAKPKVTPGTEPRARDPEREKHIQQSRESNGYSGNREQIRKAIRDLHENRDRVKDEGPQNDRVNEQWTAPPDLPPKPNYNKKNWNSRRQSERSVDDEPEWFTAGPTSRLDTIELKGFEDDDKLHSKEAGESKESDEDKNDNTKGREEELAMDPLGNPEITRSNQQISETNDSMYGKTGLPEDWDPTSNKFNVNAFFNSSGEFIESGKDLLEGDNNGGGESRLFSNWTKSSSPKDGSVPFAPADVHFGENPATSSLKAMLGLREDQIIPGTPPEPTRPNHGGMPKSPNNMHPGFPTNGPSTAPPYFDNNAVIRHLLQGPPRDARQFVRPGEAMMRPDLVPNGANIPPGLREAFLQRSQSEHHQQHSVPPGMLPHPGHIIRPGDPLFRDPRLVDPRLVDPRLIRPEHPLHSPTQQSPFRTGPPQAPSAGGRAGSELLKAVKNDPVQLEKLIAQLQSTLQRGNVPPETQATMSALLREMEKAKHEHLREAAKMKTLQFLAESQHAAQRKKQQEQIIHDKTQELKALLQLPGGVMSSPILTAPARIAPGPPSERDMRPENIPTRITSHQDRLKNSRNVFPMAFTPTSVMRKLSEDRHYMRPEDYEQLQRGRHNPAVHNNLPDPGRSDRHSPYHEDYPKPVPTIDTNRVKMNMPFPANVKGLPAALLNMLPQVPNKAGAVPHSPNMHSQLLMQELMHKGYPLQQPPPPMELRHNGVPR